MVWKCIVCKRGRHAYRICANKWKCDCKCTIGSRADVTQKSLAIGSGFGLIIAGIALTVCTGGIGAVLVGGALIGAGVSATWNGAEKAIKKERIDGTTFAVDAVFGAITGAVTGGVGAAGETISANIVKQGAKEVTKVGVKKFAIRLCTGAFSGLTTKFIDEIKQCLTTNKEWSNFGKSYDKDGDPNGSAAAWFTSAIAGAFGGVGSHIGSNLSEKMSSNFGKSLVRMILSGTTSAVSDASIQGVNCAMRNQDEYDFKRTATCFTSSAIMAGVQEATKNFIYHLSGGKNDMLNDRTNRKLINDEVPKEDKQAVLEAYENLKNIPQSKLDEESAKAFTITNYQVRKDHHQSVIENYDKKIQVESTLKRTAIDTKDYSAADKHTKTIENLVIEKKVEIKNFQDNKPMFQKSDIEHLTKHNVHCLTGDKVGQVASDVRPTANAPRGKERVTFNNNINENGQSEFEFAGFNKKHEFNKMAGPSETKQRFTTTRTTHEDTLKINNQTTSTVIRNGVETFTCRKEKKKKEKMHVF
ncbi:hypothetical protein I4U23_013728 [Adineta vaga]|nr:hypothetical protein I4U23_013728 [Adineta vaga]